VEEGPQKKAYLITLGCPKNSAISEEIIRKLKRSGYVLQEEIDSSELILVNTCGFIESAKEESINAILSLTDKKISEKKLVVFGCLVQRYKDDLTKAIPEVDIMMDFNDLNDIEKILGLSYKDNDKSIYYLSENRSWEYLQISDGCDRKCSFCAIPNIKGRYRSNELSKVIEEAELLVRGGARELTLVGQDTSMYGLDLHNKTGLDELLSELAMIDDLRWIRIMYQQIESLSSKVMEKMAGNPKICNYLDLPLQHSSRKILRSMNRFGDDAIFLDAMGRIRKDIDDIAIRTSVIVGYPGESESDFQGLIAFIEELEPDYLGVFEYSNEEGTKAAQMRGQKSASLKRTRANTIREIADRIGVNKKMDMVGEEKKAIVDSKIESGRYLGRLESQAPEIDGETVIYSSKRLKSGDMVRVAIEGTEGYDVNARLCNKSEMEQVEFS